MTHQPRTNPRDGRKGSERLFNRFNEMLEARGLIGREGSLVDASFVDAPRQRNTREQNASIKSGERPDEFDPDTARGKQKDCDARWAKKLRLQEPRESRRQEQNDHQGEDDGRERS